MTETITVELGPVVLTVALHAGPRLLGYALPGGPQLFADLPDTVISHPAVGEYRLLGGHRLWRAPEDAAVTYVPDDDGVVVTPSDGGVDVVGPPDPEGVVKQITVRQRGDVTVVDHVLRNEGRDVVHTAPWAITQLAPGGTAVLPQPMGNADTDGLLPNRHVVWWPYSDPRAPELDEAVDALSVHASLRPSKFKLGQPNRRGWLAYEKDGQLFVKWAPVHRDADKYVDFDASVQCYRDERFLELETLGPLVTLEPGDEVRHRELWALFELGDQPAAAKLASLAAAPPEMEL
jgi:hypothetical protein